LDFLDFQFLTTEFGLAKEFQDQSRKGALLYFHIFLCGNEFLGPKKRKKSLDPTNFFFKWADVGIKKSLVLRRFHNEAIYPCNWPLSKVRAKILFSENN
jgi:hypothetical protein